MIYRYITIFIDYEMPVVTVIGDCQVYAYMHTYIFSVALSYSNLYVAGK